ncbi:MAG: GAF domain-containing SpoIIE family protein phosphatase [Thermoleophilia bacterium]
MSLDDNRDNVYLATLEHLLALHAASSDEAVLETLVQAACAATSSRLGTAGLSTSAGTAGLSLSASVSDLSASAGASASGWYDAKLGWMRRHLTWQPGEGGPGKVLQSGAPLICNSLPCASGDPDRVTGILDLYPFACVPLATAAGNVLGFVEVGNKPAPYAVDDVRCLTTLGHHAALRLRELQRESERAAVAHEQENFCATQTEIARRLQRLLLPNQPPHVAGVDVGIFYRSSSTNAEIGGDFVDFCAFSPGLLSAAIGDVSGKGVEAAAITVMTKYALRAVLAAQWPPRPGDALAEVNNALSLQVDDMRFVTLCLGLLDTKRASFAFSSAGHPAPWILRADAVERAIVLAEPPIAVRPTFDSSPYPTEHIRLNPGDAVLLFTDGIAEVRNAAGDFYDEARLQAALYELRNLPAQQLVEDLYADAESFAANNDDEAVASIGDDVALVCLRLLDEE